MSIPNNKGGPQGVKNREAATQVESLLLKMVDKIVKMFYNIVIMFFHVFKLKKEVLAIRWSF